MRQSDESMVPTWRSPSGPGRDTAGAPSCEFARTPCRFRPTWRRLRYIASRHVISRRRRDDRRDDATGRGGAWIRMGAEASARAGGGAGHDRARGGAGRTRRHRAHRHRELRDPRAPGAARLPTHPSQPTCRRCAHAGPRPSEPRTAAHDPRPQGATRRRARERPGGGRPRGDRPRPAWGVPGHLPTHPRGGRVARCAAAVDGERDRPVSADLRASRRRGAGRPGRGARPTHPLGRGIRPRRVERRRSHGPPRRRRPRGRRAPRRRRGAPRAQPARHRGRPDPAAHHLDGPRPRDRARQLTRPRQGEPIMSDNTSRMRTIFRSKTTKALDRIEDPRDTLDDSYDQQVKLLHEVRRAVAEVATAKKRIELQGQEMGGRYQRLGVQARDALTQGHEDLARAALERRALLEGEVAKLQAQYSSLEKQASQLQERERRLTDQIAAFRVEKETIKATYTASAAQVRANEAVAGLSANIDDIGTSLDRARDRVAQMQARAAATDELLTSGVLKDLTAAPDADIERQLAAITAQAEVERRLQSMRDAAGSDAPAAERGDQGPDGWLSIGQGPAS
ncbi:hypothetical protein GJR97_13175 [Agromyces sp. Q22]|uniref:PspA/IM30 family protein n=2 Tax=Agromyces kandeliae TaxID=2666141 RepID=A0A6L5R515_9MICO|nr:hypothetical protein [Agromyces kandeliae]